MADGSLNRITLAAGSIADDLGYVALADIAHLLDTQTTEYRIIGGLMVTAPRLPVERRCQPLPGNPGR